MMRRKLYVAAALLVGVVLLLYLTTPPALVNAATVPDLPADLEAYLASSQSVVEGTVTLQSQGGSVLAVAIESDNILQDPNAVYAQSCDWTPEEAEGFIKLLGQSSTMAARVRAYRR